MHIHSAVLTAAAYGLAAATGLADPLVLVVLTFVIGVVWGTILVCRYTSTG